MEEDINKASDVTFNEMLSEANLNQLENKHCQIN